MRKNNIILLFVLLFSITASNCKKKNYPSDIPKWLKVKIDQMNKDYRKKNFFSTEKFCNYIVPRKVQEYSDGSSTFYWIGSAYGGYVIYNYNGQEVCFNGNVGSLECSNYGNVLVRKIWEENCR